MPPIGTRFARGALGWPRRCLAQLRSLAPWPEDDIPPAVPRVAWTAATIALLGVALLARPNPQGDALEYLQMTESLARHATPEARAGDVLALGRQDHRIQLGLNYVYSGYFDDPGGTWYACHFWAYSLLVVPARLLLPAFGVSGLRAFPVTNALFMALALHRILFATSLRPRARLALFALLLVSPVLFFVLWPHAEAITAATATLALVELYRGRRVSAVLWSALGSLQSPPLAVLLAVAWISAVWHDRRPRTLAAATLAAAPAALAPAFYWLHFGVPSLIAREAASASNLSPARALELLLDLDIGLVAYMPFTVLLLAVASAWALARARSTPIDAALVLALPLMALSTTATGNWNHGTIGPSRYAVWLLPIVLFLVVRLGEGLGRRAGAAFWAVLSLALISQALVVGLKGGPLARPDYLEHSWAARIVLRYAPALYNPSLPVFAARTTHQMLPGPGPYVYAEAGVCRKALVRARPEDEAALRDRCGSLPAAAQARFRDPSDPEAWFYVDY